MFSLAWTLLAAGLVAGGPASAAANGSTPMVVVGPGVYRPLYPVTPSEREVPVAAFRLDRTPVTASDFLAFVRSHPTWRRDRVPLLFADERYLGRWQAPEALGPMMDPREPVVDVSWFAARAYCAARGLRLPSEAEWEVAAAASDREADASGDAAWRAHVLELETRPAPPRLPRVGETRPNYWGVQDLHGLTWEWVLDFDSAALGNGDGLRSCAQEAPVSGDGTDFAAFARVAMRSALRASFTTHELGFRCAGDPIGGAR